MFEHQHELPNVSENDVLDADAYDFFESQIDPSHRTTWHQLRNANPLLADSILKEALRRSNGGAEQGQLLAIGIYVVELINISLLREKESSSVVFDDEVQRPSSEPDDDQ
jgi:hypothetical protein